jgi:hypothetical protein
LGSRALLVFSRCAFNSNSDEGWRPAFASSFGRGFDLRRDKGLRRGRRECRSRAADFGHRRIIARVEPFFEENGFYEKEIARRTEQFGNIAHVWSIYESRHNEDDPEPFMRGINSIQLFNDGKRWWIVNIYWQQESAENPIPEKYLK